MSRAWYSKTVKEFLKDSNDFIVDELTRNHLENFSELRPRQKVAWEKQIKILQKQLVDFPDGHILFEYTIPRMGERVDVVIIHLGFVFVIEFKTREEEFKPADIRQTVNYALDLKNFHKESEKCNLVPILIALRAKSKKNIIKSAEDRVFEPILCTSRNLHIQIKKIIKTPSKNRINAIKWEESSYKPTPTIIEAAQYLYENHDVKEISRSEAGVKNLTETTKQIKKIIKESKEKKKKSICFITGVPGSGKTLAGLNIAIETQNFEANMHAVFLSGNDNLVKILRETLAQSDVENHGEKKSDAMDKHSGKTTTKAFIQNVHHFRDDHIGNQRKPHENVVIFDEAQRAWTKEKTTQWMKQKQKQWNNQSEPEFLLSVANRKAWCTVICLVGGGQEISTGEAGLPEWFKALRETRRKRRGKKIRTFLNWKIHLSPEINNEEHTRGTKMSELLYQLKTSYSKKLHLKTSIRSFRSDNVSKFVNALLDVDKQNAQKYYKKIRKKYPVFITRDLSHAKKWVRKKMRGNERGGLVASSNGYRLFPDGIYVKNSLDVVNWFLSPKDDVRSSSHLELVATEFEIQGLEIDWACIAWDADLRFTNNSRSCYKWSNNAQPPNWRNASADEQLYIKNAYRVLLTRARQGIVIFIPKGDAKDCTRKPEFYNSIYNYFEKLGIEKLP